LREESREEGRGGVCGREEGDDLEDRVLSRLARGARSRIILTGRALAGLGLVVVAEGARGCGDLIVPVADREILPARRHVVARVLAGILPGLVARRDQPLVFLRGLIACGTRP
jgi:hypothetical protein